MPKEFQQQTWDAAAEADCRRIIRAAVLEDLDRGYDWTTLALVSPDAVGRAAIVARREGVIAGLPAAALVADEMDKRLAVQTDVNDGKKILAGEVVATLSGPVRSILAAERLILNLLGRLSGIASLTRQYVDHVAGTKARIYDTRKTTPGWRRLEKYAVRQGGGSNHRAGLFDAILIKDNHLAFLSQAAVEETGATTPMPAAAPRGDMVALAVRQVRAFLTQAFAEDRRSNMIVEVEVDSVRQLEAVLLEQPDIVLVDNMPIDDLRRAVLLRDSIAADVELEASGGINLTTVRAIAHTGIERISVGALTHSATVLDLGLDWHA
jgi:nicotinate-nucleotide pyrophosphorylase (carboxylating)